jgi:phosphoribosylamine--glycine ligase
MNIGILSSTSSFHHLAQLFAKTPGVDNVYHYGANKSLEETDNYHPQPGEIHLASNLTDNQAKEIIAKIQKDAGKKIDFIMASGTPVPAHNIIHDGLKFLGIPYFFIQPKLVRLEADKAFTKKMLAKIGIPHSTGEEITGKYLYENYKSLKPPFVLKVISAYQNGRQTHVVTEENFEEVFLDLFSVKDGQDPRCTNIRSNTKIFLEKFVKIKREYSYHFISNASGWKYLGTARDYKRVKEDDLGFNCASMGAYNTDDIDPQVHEYADKIYNHLKSHNYIYKGFMFLGIAVDENDVPIILEINARAGDPELQAILGSVKNNLADLFLACSLDLPIPDIVHNDNKTVTIRVVNSDYQWIRPASFLPKLGPLPENIICGIEGTDSFYIKHSVFTASNTTHKGASKILYDYLDKQYMGQYRYRRDIGILE